MKKTGIKELIACYQKKTENKWEYTELSWISDYFVDVIKILVLQLWMNN